MVEVNVNRLGVLGALGVWTDEPALFALLALFGLFASDRTVDLPTPG
jgi:hypothetical protein